MGIKNYSLGICVIRVIILIKLGKNDYIFNSLPWRRLPFKTFGVIWSTEGCGYRSFPFTMPHACIFKVTPGRVLI